MNECFSKPVGDVMFPICFWSLCVVLVFMTPVETVASANVGEV